ncbi:MAG TPA: glycosyltransferase family 4 protein [Candidatus Acidoferrales bacterium]
MKLLILTQYFPPEIGAPQTRLFATAMELTRLGHQVEVVTSMPNYPQGVIPPEYRGSLYRREEQNGIVIHRVWAYPAMGGGFRRMLNYLSFATMSILGLIRSKKPDYVFIESPPLILSIPGFLFSRLWGAPSILNVADLTPQTEVALGLLKSPILKRIMFALEGWSYRHATWVNAVTCGIQDCLIEEKHLSPEKVLFLPNGVDTFQYRPSPADTELKRNLGLEGKKVILYPGTIGHAHALDVVLRAAVLLEDRSDLHFLFVGGGSEKNRLARLSVELKLRNLTFVDPVSSSLLTQYFSIAYCGLASLRGISAYDSARPAKVFPIMASGKALIFVGQGEGAKLVERANAGVVVPPEDAELLAAAVRELLDHPERCHALGSNGREYVEVNLQWATLIGNWIAQMRQLGRQRGFAADTTAL